MVAVTIKAATDLGGNEGCEGERICLPLKLLACCVSSGGQASSNLSSQITFQTCIMVFIIFYCEVGLY